MIRTYVDRLGEYYDNLDKHLDLSNSEFGRYGQAYEIDRMYQKIKSNR